MHKKGHSLDEGDLDGPGIHHAQSHLPASYPTCCFGALHDIRCAPAVDSMAIKTTGVQPGCQFSALLDCRNDNVARKPKSQGHRHVSELMERVDTWHYCADLGEVYVNVPELLNIPHGFVDNTNNGA